MQDKRPAWDWGCSVLSCCLYYQNIRASTSVAVAYLVQQPGSARRAGVVAPDERQPVRFRPGCLVPEPLSVASVPAWPAALLTHPLNGGGCRADDQ
jgi:hypothetical protein